MRQLTGMTMTHQAKLQQIYIDLFAIEQAMETTMVLEEYLQLKKQAEALCAKLRKIERIDR